MNKGILLTIAAILLGVGGGFLFKSISIGVLIFTASMMGLILAMGEVYGKNKKVSKRNNESNKYKADDEREDG